MRALLSALLLLTASSTTGCHMGLLGLAAGAGTSKGSYQAGTIATELGPSSVQTLGCLDVGLAVKDRDDGFLETDMLVLELHVGNRCPHPEALDLQRLVIRGVDSSGGPRSVVLYDPRREIVPLHVGGEERGHERIRLDNSYGLDHLCFHLGAVAPNVAEARPLPLCFKRRGSIPGGEGWAPTAT